MLEVSHWRFLYTQLSIPQKVFISSKNFVHNTRRSEDRKNLPDWRDWKTTLGVESIFYTTYYKLNINNQKTINFSQRNYKNFSLFRKITKISFSSFVASSLSLPYFLKYYSKSFHFVLNFNRLKGVSFKTEVHNISIFVSQFIDK